jgi:hypothetical protein
MRTLALLVLVLPAAFPAQRSAYPPRPVELVIDIGKGKTDVFAGFTHLDVSKDGLIYVLEGRPCSVKVFDTTGKLVRRFGSVGEGKGQCRMPGGIEVDSVVTVVDVSRGDTPYRYVRFSLDGKAGDVKSVPYNEVSNQPRLVRGGTTVRTKFGNGGHTIYVTTEGGKVDSLFRFTFDYANIKRGEAMSRGISGFGNSGAWASLGDSIAAFADGYTGEVKWYLINANGASVIRTASMGVKPDTITADELVAQGERLGRIARVAPGSPLPPPVPITISDAPPYWSLATIARFSSDGSLWVGNPRRSMFTTRLNGDYQNVRVPYTVFPSSGDPYSVNLPVAFVPYAIVGDLVYGHSSDPYMGSITVFRLK